MTDVMIDLETLSIRPNAVILVIGAIKFNRGETWDKITDEHNIEKLDYFYTRICISSCLQEGLCVDQSTEKWWNEQEYDVKYEALLHPDRTPVKEALLSFSKWFGHNYNTKIWGNGSSFDCTILSEAFKRCGMEKPWKFYNERDLRTIIDLGGIKISHLPQYKKHNALWDCYRQIIGFQMAEKKIGLNQEIIN
jgi:DNA polymerase III epsilon subunit-like protein